MPYSVTVCKTCDMLTDAPEHGPEGEYCEAPDGFERIELFTEREVARRVRDARGDDEAARAAQHREDTSKLVAAGVRITELENEVERLRARLQRWEAGLAATEKLQFAAREQDQAQQAFPARSPQGEDHEAEIPEAALDAAEQAVHACRHYALGHPSRRALYVDARDEAYDVLAAALPHLAARSPQGEGHETARLRSALKRLRDLKGGDPEGGHIDADKVLLDLIDDDDIREAFEAISKWYG